MVDDPLWKSSPRPRTVREGNITQCRVRMDIQSTSNSIAGLRENGNLSRE
jgi:hypothetical protein